MEAGSLGDEGEVGPASFDLLDSLPRLLRSARLVQLRGRLESADAGSEMKPNAEIPKQER